jgi:hypothetical protein
VDNDSGFTINSKLYSFLKWIAFIVLPALATFVIGLGLAIHWNDSQPTAAVITLLDTFLGALLGKSSANFKAQNTLGDLIVTQSPDGTADGMRIVGTKEDPVFKDGGQVTLNVKREQKLE